MGAEETALTEREVVLRRAQSRLATAAFAVWLTPVPLCVVFICFIASTSCRLRHSQGYILNCLCISVHYVAYDANSVARECRVGCSSAWTRSHSLLVGFVAC